MLQKCLSFAVLLSLSIAHLFSVTPGVEVFMREGVQSLRGKRIGIVTNHTAVNRHMEHTVDLLKEKAREHQFKIVALFAPEHGLSGASYAEELVEDQFDADGIPVYSLHGKTRRPTEQMLKGIDLLIYDIQDIGCRSYTYSTTLFYVMEEAAKKRIPVIVFDRPNPLGGTVVDGPMMEEKWRSIVGYINVPYCHGMTIGELARFFNREYNVDCSLKVIPMQGWQRRMTFEETGLPWIPTSPNIPESSTTFYYPVTGLLGELQVVNIGVGYSLPFKVIGAPWVDGHQLSEALNKQNFPGVKFTPFHYKPFFGKFAKETLSGVLIVVTDPNRYQPVATQYLIIGILKSLYPKEFGKAFQQAVSRREMFAKVNGTDAIWEMIANEPYIVWKLKEFQSEERKEFLKKRAPYLLYL